MFKHIDWVSMIPYFSLLVLIAIVGFVCAIRINAQDEAILKQEERIQQLEKTQLTEFQRKWVKYQASNGYCSAYPDKCGE